MSGVALVNPKKQFFSSTGAPLAQGTVDVYLAGTTTRTTTWQDQTQLTANTNPIELDSRGECVLWVDDGLTYKFVLKNAGGVEQYTMDNVSGAPSAASIAVAVSSYAALRAYSGSSRQAQVTGYLVSADPSPTSGIFTRDDADTTSADDGGTVIVAANGKRWKRQFTGRIDVRWFGAVGDGATDDYTAIMKAAAVAFTQSKGLILPNATYAFDTPLVFTGVDIEFDSSSLFYTGTYGSFMMTLNSRTGSGTDQTIGNKFTGGFTLYQTDFTAYTTYSNTAADDPPSIPAGDAISDIGGLTTTVTVTGARVGGTVALTFSTLHADCEMVGRVNTDDTVIVEFFNWSNGAVNMASGTLQATVTNPDGSLVSGSKTYDPANMTQMGYHKLVTVTGARSGGYARATFDQTQDGIVITARVISNDTVRVSFSNYSNSAINLASGTITVNVVNNAYHGLCLGGGKAMLEGAKVYGTTGVAVGWGDGVDITSGVQFPASVRCYYWMADIHCSPSAGWGVIIPPRNNGNQIDLTTGGANSFADFRANCINVVTIGGIANTFGRMVLESVPSERVILLTPGANNNNCQSKVYVELSSSYAVPPFPRFEAQRFSASNDFFIRHPYSGSDGVLDEGTANRVWVVAGSYVNGQQQMKPEGSRNLLRNGNLSNGLNNYTDFSSGGVWAISGNGFLSGKRARIDLVAGQANLQQNLHTVSGLDITSMADLNLTMTATGWVKTNIPDAKLRFGGLSSTLAADDEIPRMLSVPVYLAPGVTTLSLSVMNDANATGYIEVSDLRVSIGTLPMTIGEEPVLTGSATYNPASLAAGATQQTTVTVSGAATGDLVTSVSHSQVNADIVWFGQVTATDTVTVTQWNRGAGAVDLLSGTLRVRVQKA